MQTLAGSYGNFDSIEQRHQLNVELVPAFRQKFFEGGKMPRRSSRWSHSANGRHFFTYFRDTAVAERSSHASGSSGDLARTQNDYLGVFTQNLNGSKTDYWQHREVASTVDLHADGSAGVHLKVDVSNQAPPYTLPVPDPRSATRPAIWVAVIGVFLPRFAQLGDITADGAPYSPTTHRPKVQSVQNRRYFTYKALLPRDQSANVRADYTVPFAAEVTSKSTMTYQLDVDPQDLVNPESLDVSVTFPKGWSATSLPAGWQPTARGAHWKGPVPVKLHFEIPLEKTSATS